MPSMMIGHSHKYYKQLQMRRIAYAQKLHALGIIENGSKWRSLMHRKGL